MYPSASSSRMAHIHKQKRKGSPWYQLSVGTPLGTTLRQCHELPSRDSVQTTAMVGLLHRANQVATKQCMHSPLGDNGPTIGLFLLYIQIAHVYLKFSPSSSAIKCHNLDFQIKQLISFRLRNLALPSINGYLQKMFWNGMVQCKYFLSFVFSSTARHPYRGFRLLPRSPSPRRKPGLLSGKSECHP